MLKWFMANKKSIKVSPIEALGSAVFQLQEENGSLVKRIHQLELDVTRVGDELSDSIKPQDRSNVLITSMLALGFGILIGMGLMVLF